MDIGSLTGQLEIEDQLSSSLALAGQQVRKFADSFEGLTGSVVVGGAAIVAALGAITGAIITLGNRGSDVNDVTATFNTFSGSVENAESTLANLREGTLGTVDDFDLMKAASKLLAGDVKLTSDQFGTLSKAAFVLQNQGLGPTKDMLDLVSQAMLTGQTRALQMKIGKIDLESATRKYAQSLGVEESSLTEVAKTEAKRIAILDALDKKVKAAGAQQRDFGEMMEFVVVKIKNWGDELASRVAASPAVIGAVQAIGDAIVRNFGGAGQTAIETIVGWIDRFATGVAYYGPKIIDMIAGIARWILEVWTAVRKTWDDTPQWFRNIAIDASKATLAVYATGVAMHTITGEDVLTNVASAATIWSGFGAAITKATVALKGFVAVLVLSYQIGGLSTVLSTAGTAIAGAFSGLLSTTLLVPAALAGIVAGVYQVASAIDHARTSTETWWELLSRKEDDNWLRRLLGLTTKLKEATSSGPLPILSPGFVSGGAAAARERDERTNMAAGYGPATQLTNAAEEYSKKIKQLQDEIFGSVAMQKARDMAAALGDVSKVTLLSSDSQRKVNEIMLDANEIYKRHGQVAPRAIRDWAAATVQALPAVKVIEGVSSDFEKIGRVAAPAMTIAMKTTEGFGRSLDDLGTSFDTSAAYADVYWELQKAIDEDAKNFIDDLYGVGDALTSLGQVSGGVIGTIVSGLGQVFTGWANAARAVAQYKTQVDGATKAQKAASLIGGASDVIGATGSGSTAGRTIGGAMAGAGAGLAIGAAFAPETLGLSLVLGAAAGALVGWVRGMSAAAKEAKKLREEQRVLAIQAQALRGAFVTTAGGLDQLTLRAETAGTSLKELFDAKNPDAYRMAVENLNNAFEFQDSAMKLLDETAAKYGLTLAEMGPQYRQGKLNESFQELYKDQEILMAGGVEFDLILSKQAESYKTLIQSALETGASIPQAMRPAIERMLELGLLTDEAGNALFDISTLNFAETLDAKFASLLTSIEKLVDAISRGLGGALQSLPTPKAPWQDWPPPPGYTPEEPSEAQQPAYYAGGGTVVNWKARGSDTVPAMLTPGERVIPRGGGGGTAVIELSGRKIAEIVVPEIPGVVKRYGIR